MFLKDSLILDLFTTNMAYIGCLAVLHAYMHLHVVFGSKANNNSQRLLMNEVSIKTFYSRIMFRALWTDELAFIGRHM